MEGKLTDEAFAIAIEKAAKFLDKLKEREKRILIYERALELLAETGLVTQEKIDNAVLLAEVLSEESSTHTDGLGDA